MCGICGELRFDGQAPRERDLIAARDRLRHRGPDSDGVYVAPSGRAGLAYRRLRVIDLSANGSQPLPNEDGSVQLVFNGEIYNYRELRRGLVERGHRFRSRTDSEVIVHLYEEKGADCVADLDGMFAFAIWDERRQQLTLARDRAGKKPLFQYRSDRLIAFASEVKAFIGHPDIPIELDADAIPSYFLYGYVPHPATCYRGIEQIEPGGLVTIDAAGATKARRYWRLEYPRAAEVRPVARAEAASRVRALLTDAVERRLISDVPLGAFLSGGLDSTIVVGLMSRLQTEPVKTFSIGFEGDPAYDETAYARLAATEFRTDHTELRVAPAAVDLIDTLIWHHDGPFADSSAVPTYLVSRMTRETVTVALTGDGGDEVFAGYERFYAALLAERIPGILATLGRAATNALPTPASDRHWLARAARFFRAAELPFDERLAAFTAPFFDQTALLHPDLAAGRAPVDPLRHIRGDLEAMRGLSPLSRALYANFVSYLPDDLLVKADRCTMASSLEARSPFLDRRLVEYVAALPDDCKLRGREGKSILREAFADLVPAPILRRRKMGFGVPLSVWFRRELREYVRDLLLDPNARSRAFVSRPFVERLVGDHASGAAHGGLQLWSLICFERWLRLLPDWRRGSSPADQTTLADLHAH
jgi:asparagine synthase (glutamine-hydrolysing)